jgi:hypothetical protein
MAAKIVVVELRVVTQYLTVNSLCRRISQPVFIVSAVAQFDELIADIIRNAGFWKHEVAVGK